MITTVPNVASIVIPVIKLGLPDAKVIGFPSTNEIALLGVVPASADPVRIAAPLTSSKETCVRLKVESIVIVAPVKVYVQKEAVEFAIVAIYLFLIFDIKEPRDTMPKNPIITIAVCKCVLASMRLILFERISSF